jgi:tetratricopeptide (TPR) repeat protein
MSRAASDELLQQARSQFESGDFRRCWELARDGLAERPDDVGLLRLAGQAGLELDEEGGLEYLQKAAALAPEDAEVLRDLAEAFVLEGRTGDAVESLQRASRLRPTDVAVIVDLAHVTHASGDVQVAIGYLEQALELDFNNLAALRGLVGMYREVGRLDESLGAGRKVISYRPDDVGTAIDVAELTLELDRFADALEAFRWLRDIDDEPDHEVYAMHGMIEAELRLERWRAALDLAVDATRVDRFGRTTDILAFTVAQVFGAGDRPAPSRRDVDDALAASRDEHRRLHAALGF